MPFFERGSMVSALAHVGAPKASFYASYSMHMDEHHGVVVYIRTVYS